MARSKPHRQRRIEGGRTFLVGGFAPEVEKRIEQDCKRFNVTRSFVISVAAADAMGIKLDEEDRYK